MRQVAPAPAIVAQIERESTYFVFSDGEKHLKMATTKGFALVCSTREDVPPLPSLRGVRPLDFKPRKVPFDEALRIAREEYVVMAHVRLNEVTIWDGSSWSHVPL